MRIITCDLIANWLTNMSFQALSSQLARLVCSMIKISIKTLSGKGIAIEVVNTDWIERVKEKIQDKKGIASDQQRLIFCGEHLKETLVLIDCNTHDQATLPLVLRLRG